MKDTLKPLAVIMVLAYSAGSPVFAEVRPRALDMPLRGFHKDVTAAAFTGVGLARAAAQIDAWEIAANITVSGKALDTTARSLARVNAGG